MRIREKSLSPVAKSRLRHRPGYGGRLHRRTLVTRYPASISLRTLLTSLGSALIIFSIALTPVITTSLSASAYTPSPHSETSGAGGPGSGQPAYGGSGGTQVALLAPRDPAGYGNTTIAIPDPRGSSSDPGTGILYVAGGCQGPCSSGGSNAAEPQSALYTVSASGNVLHRTLIPSPYSASQVAEDPSTGVVWVASTSASAGLDLSAFDATSYSSLKNFSLSSGSVTGVSMALDSETDMVYVAVPNAHDPVYAISGDNYEESCISVTGCISPSPFVGGAAEGVAVDPVTDTVYVSASPNTLYIVNGRNDQITNSVRLPGGSGSIPGSIAVDPSNGRVYLADGTDVYVIDGASGSIISTILDVLPQQIAVIDDSKLNAVYITSLGSCFGSCFTGELKVVDGSNDVLNSTIVLGTESSADPYVSADPTTNTVYADCCGNDVLAFRPSNGTSTLTVAAETSDGIPLLGYTAVLNQSGTVIVAKGYTPATFTLNNGQEYTVGVDNYSNCRFDRWLDTGSSTDVRPISISNNTQLTAVLDCSVGTTSSTTSNTSTNSSSTSRTTTTTTGNSTSQSSSGSTTTSSSSSTGSSGKTTSSSASSSSSTSSATTSRSTTTGQQQQSASPPLAILAATGIVAAAVFVVGTTLAFWRRRR